MVLQEMRIHLTCPEDLFRAPSAADFASIVRSRPRESEPAPLLTDCVRQLCANNPDTEIITYLENASKLNLFTIATGMQSLFLGRIPDLCSDEVMIAIHGLIFHHKSSFIPISFATGPLNEALTRWEACWLSSLVHLARYPTPTQLWMEDGFAKHADEFASLARFHLQRANISSEQWSELVNNLPISMVEKVDGIATFDQTNMDQIASLISAIEHINFNEV